MAEIPVRLDVVNGSTSAIAASAYAGLVAFDDNKLRFVGYDGSLTLYEFARRDVQETFADSIKLPSLGDAKALVTTTGGEVIGLSGVDMRVFLGNVATEDFVNDNFQPLNTANLSAIAALTTASFGRSLLEKTSQAEVRTYLDVQPLDATLTALAGLTTGADKLPYFTGTDTVTTTTLTSFARTLLDDANLSSAQTTLNIPDAAGVNWGTSQLDGGDPFASRESYDIRGGVRTAFGVGPFSPPLTNEWYNMVDVRHRNGASDGSNAYGGQLVWLMLNGSSRIAYRSRPSGTWGSWIEISTVGHDHASITVGGTTRISGAGAISGTSLDSTGGVTAADHVVVTKNSTAAYLEGNIWNQYSTTTLTGSQTNASLAGSGVGSRTIGAGRLNALGSGIRIYAAGYFSTDATPGTAEFRVRIGSTTLRTTGTFNLDASITNGFWRVVMEITCRTTGATGTLGGMFVWEHAGSTVAGQEVLHVEKATSVADVTIDLTASQAVDIDWSASDAGTSISCTCFHIDITR